MNSGTSTNTTTLMSIQSLPNFKENSRASIFSTVVALCLCCLTQPQGGLLFPGRSNWYWRLSPISALLEAAMIFFCLLFRRNTATRPRTRLGETEPILGVTDLAGAPFAAAFKSRDRRIPHHLSRVGVEVITIMRFIGIAGGWRTCAGVLLLLRSRGDPDMKVSADEVRRLLETRSMRRTKIWTAISMLFLVIKLCVVKGAPWFTGLGLCYAVSWVAVEAIVLIVDWQGLEKEDVEWIMKELPNIQTVITSRFWSRLWSTISGPFGAGVIAYFAYSILWKFDDPFQVLVYISNGLILLYALLVFPIFLVACFRKKKVANELASTVTILVIPVILIVAHIFEGSVVDDTIRSLPLLLLSLGYGMVSAVGGVFVGALLILLVVCPVIASRKLADDTSEYNVPGIIRGRALGLANMAIFGAGLTLYMYHYDAKGTVKPDWLEWIGM